MTKFTFDKAHSSLDFQVRHLMVSRINGTFDNYDVELTGDVNDLSSLQSKVTIDASSINTGIADRDNHLRSGDFLGTDENNEITFVSTKVTENTITGDLTIKGETHEETFDVEFNGVSKNPMNGGMVTGFIVTGKINREKYGINFNQALETGGVMLSKDITFEAGAEFAVED